METFPAELHGGPMLIPAAVYTGHAAEGERVLRPLRELATPLLDLSGTMPYDGAAGRLRCLLPEGLALLLEVALPERPGR